MAGFITAVEFQPIKSHVRNTCELSKMKVKHCHCEIEAVLYEFLAKYAHLIVIMFYFTVKIN